jgi:hypothetical protein
MATLLFVALLFQDHLRIRAAGPVSLLKFFASAHRADVRNAIHRQNAIQMIDLMLQQLGEVPFLSRVNFAFRPA